MKKIIFLFLILLAFKGYSQVYQVMPQYGYQMPRADIQLVLKIPSDTTNNKTGIARIGSTLYAGDGTKWAAVTGGGTSTDTTSLSNRINATNAQVTANTAAIAQRQLNTDTTTYDATKHDLTVGLNTKWGINGNTGVNSSSFLGTDYNSFKIKINNIQSVYVDSITSSVGIGFRTLGGNERYHNVAIGSGAMENVGDASDNTAIGTGSMRYIRDANGNTAVGYKSLNMLMDGENNAAFGDECLQSVTNASNNTVFGNQAGRLITGGNNTGFGSSVFNSLTTGEKNAFFGNATGQGIVTGNSNTIIGSNINNSNNPSFITSGVNNNIVIGDGDGVVKIRTDSIGNVYLPKTSYRSNAIDKMMVMDTVNKMISYREIPSGGGSGLTYPYTTNKYLNGYGTFPTLNTDSITQGSTNKFSQWVTSGSEISYSGNIAKVGTGTMVYPSTTGFSTYSSAGGASNGLNVTNTSATGYIQLLMAESTGAYGGLFRWGSSYGGNYTGTSLPFANSFQFQSGGSNNNNMVLSAGALVHNVGTVGTNAAFRSDANGLRIGRNSNIHTANTVQLEVEGTLKFVTGNEGAGKVLTSDASGNADWVTPSASGLLSSNFVYNEEFTGSTSSTYTLANTPIAGKLEVFKNGIKLPNSEFSLSGAVVTLTSARVSGDIISNNYIK